MSQQFFHAVFVAVFVTFTVIRMVYLRMAARTMGRAKFKEGKGFIAIRLIVGIPFMIALVAYMIRPSIFAWASFSLPDWLQWVGAALALLSLPLIWWVQHALGSNFSTTLHIRERHTLVTSGPYRWMRHPMYTVFYIFLLSLVLLTGNWFIGGVPLLALTLVVMWRLGREEAAMIEKFGDDYRAYMRRSGRFLPRLRRHA